MSDKDQNRTKKPRHAAAKDISRKSSAAKKRRRARRFRRKLRAVLFGVLTALVLTAALLCLLIGSQTGKDGQTDAPAPTVTAEPTAAPTPEPTATPTAEPTEAPTPEPTEVPLRSATVRIAGDILIADKMLDASYDGALKKYDFAPYFELIGDTLSSADYTMINIEGSLHKGKHDYSGYPNFRTPPEILDVVKAVGVDMITMCNNHMLDSYCDGLVESVRLIEQAGLDHIGGFLDEADSKEPEIYEINGIRVGFVNYTHSTNGMDRVSDDRSKYLVKFIQRVDYAEDIRKAREAGAEVVVAVTHWGEEYMRKPEASTRTWAKEIVAAGADIILGGHPHVVQPAEYITARGADGKERTALCVYSLGNFLSRQTKKYTDTGIVFEFTIQESRDGTFSIIDPGYVPVYVWTFKNDGSEDLRVLPIGKYLENPPSDMSAAEVKRMKQGWKDTLEVMKDSEVAKPLES